MNDVELFLRHLVEAWEERDVESACKLFSSCKVYHETPFSGNMVIAPGGIRELWKEIETQSDIKVGVKVAVQSDNRAAISYEAAYSVGEERVSSAGVWIVKMEAGMCVEFRQCFMLAPDGAP